MRGLQSDRTPVFHLPTSPLLGGLIDDVNSTLARLIEEQMSGFIPFPMKRHRRFLPHRRHFSFGTLHSVPEPRLTDPGEIKWPQATSDSPPLLSAHWPGIGETISWLDWWLSTVSGFREALHPSAQANFERILSSGSKALAFVGSQAVPALANLLLSHRDSLLAEVRSTVPAEELSLLPVWIIGVNNIDYRHLFTFSNNRTRSNGWKLELKRFNTSQCGNFFTYKIAPIWNRLPVEAVNSASVEQFKTELDKVIDTLIWIFFFF